MRANRTGGLLLLSLLFSLPAVHAAQLSPLGIESHTELVDPLDAGWFYRPERIESEKPEQLLDLLGIEEGDVVADIGAGPGFFPCAPPSESDDQGRCSRWTSSPR